MPRSGPSRADASLIAALASDDLRVSPFQLERWRCAGIIPRNERRGLGRGNGSRSEAASETLDKVRLVARNIRQGRPYIWGDVLVRFATGQDVREVEVRRIFEAELERWASKLLADAGDDDIAQDQRFEAAERFSKRAGSSPDLDVLIAAIDDEDRPSPALGRYRLANRVAAQVLSGGIGDVAEEDLIQASAVWLDIPDEDTEALLSELHERQLAGGSFLGEAIPALSLHSMRSLLGSCSFDDLRRASRATFRATTLGQGLVLMTMIAPVDRSLFADPVWSINCRFGGLSTTRREVRTMIVCGTLMNLDRGPKWLGCVEDFAERAQAEWATVVRLIREQESA